VLPGRPIQYRGRLPRSDEAALVIEVADSSLDNDRTVKKRMYSAAAIPLYWIVNLRNDILEAYARPDPLSGRYLDVREYRVNESIECELSGGCTLSVPISRLIADAA
jgi:Uma2 family endonuclease